MQTIKNIFITSLEECPNKKNKKDFVKELVLDLSRKKLYRLKDPKKIQKRVAELFELYNESLKDNSLHKTQTIQGVIEGLISAANFDAEEKLYKKIYKKEKLANEIRIQKENIYQTITTTFETISHTLSYDDNLSKIALNDAKLKGIEMLGILKETTEQALITTIERGSDIEETTKVIIKNIVNQAINEGDFRKNRFLQIAKSVLEVSIDISDNDQAHAEDILRGTIHGTKDGILKTVENFKDDLKYAPDEAKVITKYGLWTAKNELDNIENDFIDLLHTFAQNNNRASGKIIDTILKKELDNSLAKLTRLTNEAKEAINTRLEDFKENAYLVEKEFKQRASIKMESLRESVEDIERKATQKVEALKQNRKTQEVQEEAKNLGNRAWEVAKDFLKNAQEALNKK